MKQDTTAKKRNIIIDHDSTVEYSALMTV